MTETAHRASALDRAAAAWTDRDSGVRRQAREALSGSEWSSEVIEAALDDALHDFNAETAVREGSDARRRSAAGRDERPVLVILPGNVVGPAIASAFCAAAAGAQAILKSPGAERHLAPIIEEQFERLGPPLSGSIDARYWKGGDAIAEAEVFKRVRRIVVLGSDETWHSVAERSGATPLRAYAASISLGYIAAGTDYASAARGAARDICMFDQRGCMSPQTIYVEGGEGAALRFAQALGMQLRGTGETLPRARVEPPEAHAIAERVRRFSMTAIPARTHGLDTLILGPRTDGVPEFVVVVEAAGPPTHEGFGRIVAVKPCAGLGSLAQLLFAVPGTPDLDTLGYAGSLGARELQRLKTRFKRTCVLGDMQRPPFGYRPEIADFA